MQCTFAKCVIDLYSLTIIENGIRVSSTLHTIRSHPCSPYVNRNSREDTLCVEVLVVEATSQWNANPASYDVTV